MAIIYVASSAASNLDDSGGTSTTSTLVLGAAAAVDDVIVGSAGWSDETQDISTVTDNLGNSYSLDSGVPDTPQNYKARLFWSKVTVAGTPTLTVTFTAAVAFRRVIAGAWGGSAAAPLDTRAVNAQGAPGTGADAVTSTALTTAQNDELLVGMHINTNETSPGSGTISAGTSYTSRHTNGAILALEDRILAVAGSAAATFTISVDHRTLALCIAFKPAGAGEPEIDELMGQMVSV